MKMVLGLGVIKTETKQLIAITEFKELV